MQERHKLFGQYMWRKWKIPRPVGRWLGKSGLVNRHWRLSPATNAAYQDTVAMGFYDTWVARYTIASHLQQYTDIRNLFHSLRIVVQPLHFWILDFPQR